MTQRYVLLLLAFLLAAPLAYGQFSDGQLKVKLIDQASKQPLSYGVVVAKLNGVAVAGGQTDEDGEIILTNLQPGEYVVTGNYVGYQEVSSTVQVIANQIITVNLGATLEGSAPPIVITGTTGRKLVETDKGTSGETFTREQIQKLPYRGVNAILGITGGVFTQDGSTPSIRGGRSSGTVYYVDGVRVTGSFNVPQNAIEQMSTMLGGIPAEYGDATGGVISITTRGPSRQYFGGLEAITSTGLDPFGYNLVEGYLSGPLILRGKGDTAVPVLGFFVAGNFNHRRATDPSFSTYRVQDDVLSQIQASPLQPSPFGTGFVSSAEFVTDEQMNLTRIKPNTGYLSYSGNFKLDFSPSRNINLTAGGQATGARYKGYVYSYTMFNSDNNPEIITNTYRGFVRFRQSFKSAPDARISNASYILQVDYTHNDDVTQDPIHQDNYFNYGYLGKFERYRAPVYYNETHYVKGRPVTARYLKGYSDTLITFTPGNINPVTDNYTEQYFNIETMPVTSLNQIQARGGLINGQQPTNVYSLWAAPGSVYPGYATNNSQMFTFLAQAQAILKVGEMDHMLKAGIQYEQRMHRAYSIGNATGLWTLMRQLANNHLTQFDTTAPIPRFTEEGAFTDTVDYEFKPADQSNFDRNLRNKLIANGERDVYGRLINDKTLLNIDRYDPSMYSLDMFSADELLNQGNSLISYYGYDYLGNKLARRPSIEDFLDSTKRWIAPYNPIYIAGFIQDKFVFEDLIFNIGVRVDRFDANQSVLADQYSIFPTRTVAEVRGADGIEINGNSFDLPGNIGDDYVVYVDDAFNPTKPVGYRSGSRWYDASGNELQDPAQLALETRSGSIQPYLQARNKDELKLVKESFRDYEPQVNIMPRISFSFPISEEATFFANYDVLTQRPTAGNFATIDDYYFFESRSTATISNPNLKPERRTNYELGFKQALSDITAVRMQAYYGEIRDLVQIIPVNYAYPRTYTTFGNIDFGTVKGFTFGFDKVRNLSSGVSLIMNYTLQFANGTGSNAASAQNLITTGQPNLRVPFPLDYDVRHQVQVSFDYRFGTMDPIYGEDEYTGPLLFGKRIFENAGLNLVMRARSGTPYSRQSNVTEAVGIGISQRASLQGTVNGSRLPWQFLADARFDKDFNLVGAEKLKEKMQKSQSYRAPQLNVYLWVQNILNTRNIASVYRYTGEADDDGFLTSAQGQQVIASQTFQQAFIDQYRVKVNNPDNYLQPRTIRLGAILQF